MPDPHLQFDKEEMTITLTGLGGGWSFGQIGQLDLLNSAQWTLPTQWNRYKGAVAMNVLQLNWQYNAHLVFEQTLAGGIEYTSKDGVGQSISLDSQLVAHILQRPFINLDLTFKTTLEGSWNVPQSTFEGTSFVTWLGFRGRF